MGKRRSVPEPRKPEPPRQSSLVVDTFNKSTKKPAAYKATDMSDAREEPKRCTEVDIPAERPEEARPEVAEQPRRPLLVQARKPDVVPQSDAREAGAAGEEAARGEGAAQGEGLLQRMRARTRAAASSESLHDDDSGRHTDSEPDSYSYY